MNVASLEASKELYELSGWRDTEVWLGHGDASNIKRNSYGVYFEDGDIPAYDLGYLLRKLPPYIDDSQLVLYPGLSMAGYETSYEYESTDFDHINEADTPEDAAAKLAIELFKQGILTKDERISK